MVDGLIFLIAFYPIMVIRHEYHMGVCVTLIRAATNGKGKCLAMAYNLWNFGSVLVAIAWKDFLAE